jgi:hypothetical protein
VTRIVTTVHRPKRPARKRKAVALAGPAIVRATKRRGPEPEPANDDAPAKPVPPAVKRAIATSISRKRARLARTAEPEPDDPEADALMRAWLERAKWGHGPAR